MQAKTIMTLQDLSGFDHIDWTYLGTGLIRTGLSIDRAAVSADITKQHTEIPNVKAFSSYCFCKAININPNYELAWLYLANIILHSDQPLSNMYIGETIRQHTENSNLDNYHFTITSTVAWARNCYYKAITLNPKPIYAFKSLFALIGRNESISNDIHPNHQHCTCYSCTCHHVKWNKIFELYFQYLQISPEDETVWCNFGAEIFKSEVNVSPFLFPRRQQSILHEAESSYETAAICQYISLKKNPLYSSAWGRLAEFYIWKTERQNTDTIVTNKINTLVSGNCHYQRAASCLQKALACARSEGGKAYIWLRLAKLAYIGDLQLDKPTRSSSYFRHKYYSRHNHFELSALCLCQAIILKSINKVIWHDLGHILMNVDNITYLLANTGHPILDKIAKFKSKKEQVLFCYLRFSMERYHDENTNAFFRALKRFSYETNQLPSTALPAMNYLQFAYVLRNEISFNHIKLQLPGAAECFNNTSDLEKICQLMQQRQLNIKQAIAWYAINHLRAWFFHQYGAYKKIGFNDNATAMLPDMFFMVTAILLDDFLDHNELVDLYQKSRFHVVQKPALVAKVTQHSWKFWRSHTLKSWELKSKCKQATDLVQLKFILQEEKEILDNDDNLKKDGYYSDILQDSIRRLY